MIRHDNIGIYLQIRIFLLQFHDPFFYHQIRTTICTLQFSVPNHSKKILSALCADRNKKGIRRGIIKIF